MPIRAALSLSTMLEVAEPPPPPPPPPKNFIIRNSVIRIGNRCSPLSEQVLHKKKKNYCKFRNADAGSLMQELVTDAGTGLEVTAAWWRWCLQLGATGNGTAWFCCNLAGCVGVFSWYQQRDVRRPEVILRKLNELTL